MKGLKCQEKCYDMDWLETLKEGAVVRCVLVEPFVLLLRVRLTRSSGAAVLLIIV